MSGRKAYEIAPFDTVPCAWCTNPFSRTKQQADRGTRYCCRKCASYGRALVIPDEHFRRMAKAAHRSRVASRLARLGEIVAGLSVQDAYLRGYRSGYSAGRARRQSGVVRERKLAKAS